MSRSSIRDKAGVLERSGLKLDLGCGPTKLAPEYIGVDVNDSAAVDVVGDVLDVLRTIADDSVVDVHASHVLEHLDDLSAVVSELERVLAIGGRLHVVAPHFSNAYHHSDPTHHRTFGLYTFSYLAEDHLLRRRVPNYGHAQRLKLVGVRLNFRSALEFRMRSRVKHAAGRLVNRSTWLKEAYEENLAWIFPCYELEFLLVKVR
jgi:SAM-dependent methyltransferase